MIFSFEMIFSIKTRQQALRTIRNSSIAFIIIAIFQFVASIFFYSSFLEGGILAILGLALYLTKNKFVAGLLLLYSLILIAPTFNNVYGLGSSILIGILMIFASIKALEATIKLKHLK